MLTNEPTRRDYLKAVLLTLLGFSLVPGMDAIAKYLSGNYSVLQLGWARFVFHLLFVVPVVMSPFARVTGSVPRRATGVTM